MFLSYSSEDKEIARALHERLIKEGVLVWFDEAKLTIGDNIAAAIEEALDQSRHLLVLLSPDSLGSAWATLERHVATFADADARNRTILPLVIRKVEKLPGSLRFRRYLHVEGIKDLDRVLPEILSVIKASAEAPPKPVPPPPPPRTRAVLVATCRLLAGLAALALLLHFVIGATFARQWVTVASPAILTVTIAVELMVNAYGLALLEIAALVVAIV